MYDLISTLKKALLSLNAFQEKQWNSNKIIQSAYGQLEWSIWTGQVVQIATFMREKITQFVPLPNIQLKLEQIVVKSTEIKKLCIWKTSDTYRL